MNGKGLLSVILAVSAGVLSGVSSGETHVDFSAASTAHDANRPAAELRVRDGLGRTLGKLERGEPVTVAYLGGSITCGAWREKTTAWLRTRYPKARVTEVNAALGGTGSGIGVFRYRDDVLCRRPDLVFVEFACNDTEYDNRTIRRSMEGIVRQTWKTLPETDICFTYVITGYMTNDYCRGVYHRAASVHEEIAERYGIPSVCFGLRVAKLVREGKIVMCANRELSEDDRNASVKIAFPVSGECPEPPPGLPKPVFSMDGVHPTLGGHELYANCVAEAFAKMSGREPADHAKRLEGPCIVADNLENVGWCRPAPDMLKGSWRPYVSNGDWRAETLFFADMMSNARGLVMTETPGSSLRFRFRGRKCSLYALYGPDCGQVVIRLNGRPVGKPHPLFDRYCRWYRLQEVPVYDGPETNADVEVVLDRHAPDRKSLGMGRFTDEELAEGKYRNLTFFVSKIMYDGVLDPMGDPTGPRCIQRTMRALEESTAEKPARLRFLFYGQSLVEQGWCTNVVANLLKRYPTAQIEWENRAVGGFESPLLIRAAESDLYPYYADLVFFNDYGSTKLVRTMIERLRARTTSEIVMWTDRIRKGQDPKEMIGETDARSIDLASIAADNGCMLVHVMRKWCRNLIDKGLDPMHYLADGVHLKAESGAFQLIADCITEDMVRLPGCDALPESGTVTVCPFTSDILGETAVLAPAVEHEDGSVEFPFEGNRVVAEAVSWRGCYNSSPVKVLLDGKEMSSMKELYHHGRVSGLLSWMPIILHVDSEKAPVAEDWTLTYVEGTDPLGAPIRYRVDGSVTGFDGFGRTDRDFVSDSGRVKILASDFHSWQYDYFVRRNEKRSGTVSPCRAEPGQWTMWRTSADFTDRIGTYLKPRERIVLVSGCSNGRHTLTFVPAIKGKRPMFRSLTVYKPAGTGGAVTDEEREAVAKRTPVNPDFDPNGRTTRKE